MTPAELDRLLDTPARIADELRYDQEPARVKALRAQLAQAVAAARKAVIQAGADPVRVAEVERAVALAHRAGTGLSWCRTPRPSDPECSAPASCEEAENAPAFRLGYSNWWEDRRCSTEPSGPDIAPAAGRNQLGSAVAQIPARRGASRGGLPSGISPLEAKAVGVAPTFPNRYGTTHHEPCVFDSRGSTRSSICSPPV